MKYRGTYRWNVRKCSADAMENSIITPSDDDVDDSHVENLIESLIQEEDSLQIRPETIDFLRNSHLYLQCREQLDAMYLEWMSFSEFRNWKM